MNKKNIILLGLLMVLICVLTLSMNFVSAAEYTDWCSDNSVPVHKTTWVKEYKYKDHAGIVKKDGKYYNKYDVWYESDLTCYHESHKFQRYDGDKHFGNPESGNGFYWDFKDYSGYEYEICKKGTILKQSTKVVKTKEAKGKVYQWFKKEKTYIVSDGIAKTETNTVKKLVGYYKTYKMPSTARGKLKKTTFKGVKLSYGCTGPSFSDYTVRYDERGKYYIYKVKSFPKIRMNHNPANGGYYFWKKPKYFTIYVKKY